jgi:hypothetical protein
MSNDTQELGIATQAFAESMDIELPIIKETSDIKYFDKSEDFDKVIPIEKEKRELNPIPIRMIGNQTTGYTKELTKNQFQRWALSNGVGSSYSGKKQTMFIFGENAAKILAEAKDLTKFKVEIQQD